MEALIVIILTILLCLALGWAVGKLPWQEWLEGITITFGCIAIGTLLTGCATPTPDYPVPGDPEIITSGDNPDIEFIVSEPTPTPSTGNVGLQAWTRYDPNPNGLQEIGAAMDIDGYPVQDYLMVICIEDICQKHWTNEDGQTYADFERTWDLGVVPWSVCVDVDNQPVCLRASFLAVEVEND